MSSREPCSSSPVIHSIRTGQDLLCPDSTVSLFNDRAEVSATHRETSMDFSLDTNSRSSGRNSAGSSYPDPASTIIQFISTGSHDTVTVRDASNYDYFLLAVACRITVDFRNCCLARTCRKQEGYRGQA